MKKLLLVLLLFAFVGLNATPLEIITQPDKHKTAVCNSAEITDATIVLQSNFVYLSMEKRDEFLKTHEFVMNTNLFDDLSIKNIHKNFAEDFTKHVSNRIQTQKENLVLNRIKEYLPDFNIEEEAKKPVKRLERIIQQSNNSEHFYLHHNNERIRLISFIQKPNPIDFSSNNYSVGYTEHYY